jgi:hypothetical protein
MIRETPSQEIGSHTFSHYYCLEEGQNAASFRQDLESAQRIATATLGVNLRSLVLPRNQFNPDYATAIRDAGFLCYRGNQRGGIYAAADTEQATSTLKRAARLAEAYVPISPQCLLSWDDMVRDCSLFDVGASRFLRPWSPTWAILDPLKAQRIVIGMRNAARNGRVYHLWWHPHNVGAHVDESIRFLSGILSEFRALHDEFGFQSKSMSDAADAAALATSPASPEAMPR